MRAILTQVAASKQWLATAAESGMLGQVVGSVLPCGTRVLVLQVMGSNAAQLTAAVSALINALVASKFSVSGVLGLMNRVSYARWGLEGFVIAEANCLKGGLQRQTQAMPVSGAEAVPLSRPMHHGSAPPAAFIGHATRCCWLSPAVSPTIECDT